MNEKLLSKGFKIHFIGIGGISMSALARILLEDGCLVTGSDMKSSHITDNLEKAGAKIFIGHDKSNITDQNLIVHTAAVKDDNPEIIQAKELGIAIVDRAELLGAIMKRYKTPIAISGTHGKTSTTGMVSQIFLASNADPTVTIGGELDIIGGNLRVGKKDIFIAEACEYHRSFLKFFPKYTLMLNIEADHLDFFKDLDDIIATFRDLANLTPDDGAIIANCDDANVKKALIGIDKNIITFGIENECDYRAFNISHDKTDRCNFDIAKKGEYYASVSLSVPGIHNVYNALAAFAIADNCNIDKNTIVSALGEFVGAHRRFEKKGVFNGALVVDDYAHHPSEIKATLSAADKMGYKKVWCVFQPHTYTRTKTLFDDFVKVFSESGASVIVTDIYAAREKDTGLVSARELSEKIENSVYLPSFAEVEDYLSTVLNEGELLITMGAGDVYKIGENLLNK